MQANEDVTQIVEILPSISDKWTWLTRHLVSFTSGNQRKIGKSTLRILVLCVLYTSLLKDSDPIISLFAVRMK